MKRTHLRSKRPTIINDTLRLDSIGVDPKFPGERSSVLDLGTLIRTPDGIGKVFDYRFTDGDWVFEIEFPDGSTNHYEKGQLGAALVTPERIRERKLDRQIERSTQRASAAGFRTDLVFFHSSKDPSFDAFNPKYMGSTDSGWSGLGYYFSPYIDITHIYGTPRAFRLKYSRPFVITDENVETFRNDAERLGITPATMGQWTESNGFDAVERWHTLASGESYLEEVVMFHRTRIRDVNARFENLRSVSLMA